MPKDGEVIAGIRLVADPDYPVGPDAPLFTLISGKNRVVVWPNARMSGYPSGNGEPSTAGLGALGGSAEKS